MVQKGNVIGFSGKTGKTNKNMLYYEIHIGTMAFNPHILMNDLQTLWLNLQKH
jgi:murein DD-endopeptidase MepM/ murein hydrolase activator NlpD